MQITFFGVLVLNINIVSVAGIIKGKTPWKYYKYVYKKHKYRIKQYYTNVTIQ